VRPEDRPDTPAKLDKLIHAEIPDPNNPDQVDLHNRVVQHMLHGPHDTARPLPCQADGMDDNGMCSKHYPKAFNDTTQIVPGEYAVLRRRRTGIGVIKAGKWLDNRDVVPMPILLDYEDLLFSK
jgi:hypothetical protein